MYVAFYLYKPIASITFYACIYFTVQQMLEARGVEKVSKINVAV